MTPGITNSLAGHRSGVMSQVTLRSVRRGPFWEEARASFGMEFLTVDPFV